MQSCVPADYMTRQADINEKMRAILIDWLIEVHSTCSLCHLVTDSHLLKHKLSHASISSPCSLR